MFYSVNPNNEEVVGEYPTMGHDRLTTVVNEVYDSWNLYKSTSFEDRKVWLKNVASILRERKKEFARLMTLEMGKPFLQGIAEAEKSAWVCEYYADNAENFLQDQLIETDASKSYITYLPLGVILAIMPWNFPFWQVFRFAAPSLMAGNGCLLKHAPNVTGCALIIEKIFSDAGFPDNIFKTIVTDVENVEAVIRNKKVAAVTLTGSTRAGKAVASIAGSEIKKCVLELGGSDPYIIIDDADIEAAAKFCVIGRMLNSGQSCIAAKRFLVFESVYDKFKNAFITELQTKKTGDPFDESNYIGPLARKDLRDTLHFQVQKTVEMGGKLTMGGYIPDGPGFYYPPTILEDIPEGSPAWCEELFGPVASFIKVKNIEEAIEIANSIDYGLGAAVFTSDLTKGESIVKSSLNAGSGFVNSFVKSDPRLPFGGIKHSGFGRELSPLGIKEFVNVKTVYIA
ncbi:MAG: NAD-dependent succinate-semialdehyde dehydrogenase [Ignavibacteriales bacterium]|nr:NAD-dependent succinate-semialdehyde dehydrogenase [Ignavibacteriales bacterium]